MPLSHVFGQFLGIFLPQLLAATVIFQDTLNPAEVVRAIKRERVSVVVAVPRLMESLKDKIVRDLEAAGKLSRGSSANSKPRKTSISFGAGGASAESTTSSDGSSGPSSPAAPRSTPRPKSSGGASASS